MWAVETAERKNSKVTIPEVGAEPTVHVLRGHEQSSDISSAFKEYDYKERPGGPSWQSCIKILHCFY